MTVISVQAKLTTEDLIAAIEKLEPKEASELSMRLLRSQANRRAPHLSDSEWEILKRVNLTKRIGLQERLSELRVKLADFHLSQEEHVELLKLTDEAEQFDADRLTALAELAGLRGITISSLMEQLGLKAPLVV